MKGMNRVVLVGNLGRDPETTVLKDGRVVTKLAVATTEIFRLQHGEIHADTQWHTVVFWLSLAELATKYLKRGSLVYVEGRIRTRMYTDKGGQKKYVTEIIGNKLIMLDRRSAPGHEAGKEGFSGDNFPF